MSIVMRGFTLLEILIVIGFAALLFVVSGLFQTEPRLQSLELERARELIRSDLARAQTDTIAGTEDLPWGVAFTTRSITRFAGASFATRNTSFDVATSFSSPVSISGPAEVVFGRPGGEPSAAAAITVTDGRRTYTIRVNAAGSISVE